MYGLELERAFLANRGYAKVEIVFFVNGGDPSLAVTYDLLRVLARCGVVAVELCVPFPNSVSDGPMLRASHRRALSNGATLSSILDLVMRAREEFGLAIVLLADYGYSVAPLGLEQFLGNCYRAGVSATLIHALPAANRHEYVEHSEKLGLGRIMTFFVGSNQAVRQAAYRDAQGFIYVVSQFGRSGQTVSFDSKLLERLAAIRAETHKPLALGFGIKTSEHIAILRHSGMDALIVGSSAIAVVQEHLQRPAHIATAFDRLVRQLTTVSAEVN